MDEAERKIAEQNLIEADDAIAQGREDIAKQMQLIAELTREGYDIQAATELLNTLHQNMGSLEGQGDGQVAVTDRSGSTLRKTGLDSGQLNSKTPARLVEHSGHCTTRPELLRGEPGPFHQRSQLCPHDRGVDALHKRSLGKAAIGAGDQVVAADELDEPD